MIRLSSRTLLDFTLDDEEIKELEHCKSGHCEVQLPTEAMAEFQSSVNWTAPDSSAQANRLAQQMALQALLRYQQGGNTALGTYRDKSRPTAVGRYVYIALGPDEVSADIPA